MGHAKKTNAKRAKLQIHCTEKLRAEQNATHDVI